MPVSISLGAGDGARSRSSSPRSTRPRRPTVGCARRPRAGRPGAPAPRPGHRAVVALHYLLGMPLPDVAASLGIPLGTAKSRLHHALAAMRRSTADRPTRPRHARSRRAGRMTARIAASNADCPSPRGPLPGAVSRLSRRGPGGRDRRAAPVVDLPRKVAPHGSNRQRPPTRGPRSVARARRSGAHRAAPRHRRARRGLAPDRCPAAVRVGAQRRAREHDAGRHPARRPDDGHGTHDRRRPGRR